MKRLYGLVFASVVSGAIALNAMQQQNPLEVARQQAIVKMAIAAYDQDKEGFMQALPQGFTQQEFMQALEARKLEVEQELASLGYKTVLSSKRALFKTSMLIASLGGMWFIKDKLNMDTLAYEVANDFANALFEDFVGGRRLLVGGKPRVHPSVEAMAEGIAYKKGYSVSVGDINRQWPEEVWSEVVPNLPEEQRNYQIIQNAPVERISALKNYPLIQQALTVGAAVSGFGLYKDIQAMRTRRNALTTELDKINAMLSVIGQAS